MPGANAPPNAHCCNGCSHNQQPQQQQRRCVSNGCGRDPCCSCQQPAAQQQQQQKQQHLGGGGSWLPAAAAARASPTTPPLPTPPLGCAAGGFAGWSSSGTAAFGDDGGAAGNFVGSSSSGGGGNRGAGFAPRQGRTFFSAGCSAPPCECAGTSTPCAPLPADTGVSGRAGLAQQALMGLYGPPEHLRHHSGLVVRHPTEKKFGYIVPLCVCSCSQFVQGRSGVLLKCHAMLG